MPKSGPPKTLRHNSASLKLSWTRVKRFLHYFETAFIAASKVVKFSFLQTFGEAVRRRRMIL